jgi:hypothetical protein
MPVKCGPNRPKTSQQGWDEMRRPHGIDERYVAESFFLFGIKRRLEPLLGLFFEGGFCLSSIHRYQILRVHDQRTFGLPLKARTKWVC